MIALDLESCDVEKLDCQLKPFVHVPGLGLFEGLVDFLSGTVETVIRSVRLDELEQLMFPGDVTLSQQPFQCL
jgi:hypothetical protein